MKIRLLITTCWLVASTIGLAQNPAELADEYFKNGDYEKAASEYAKTTRRGTGWNTVLRYTTALKKLDRISDAQRMLKKLATDDGSKATSAVLTGYLFQGDSARTTPTYTEALNLTRSSAEQSARIADLFSRVNEPVWAIKAYQQARVATKDERAFSDELASLYQATGDTQNWIGELIELAKETEQREPVLNRLLVVVNTNDEAVLEKTLYDRVQKNPNESRYNEILSWLYIQKQKFGRALIQEKAIDKRQKLNGGRVYDLGMMSLTNKEYKVAADAFDYIIAAYPQGQFYPMARRMVVNAREEQIKNTYPVDKTDIRRLIADYQRITQELGANTKTLESLRSMANLYAYYLDEKDSALAVLGLAAEIGKGERSFVDRCKLDQGDIYLLKGEPWESTLLYSQVEKSQREEILGYEAKLKNAKLHYYKGNFTLAKEILDILKQATTREIANDAESLSMLIQDNIGMDSTEAAMREYAAIDLLLFQNKTEQVIHELEKLSTKYADHTLADEIIWLRANTYLKQGKVEQALADLEKIQTTYPHDILGDDALYLQAKIQEERLKNKEAAMKLYQKLLTNYPASLFGADARKRFRSLRGDVLN